MIIFDMFCPVSVLFFYFFLYFHFILFFFFFQAEDGIRDLYVTGVQTCALPICRWRLVRHMLTEGIVLSLAGGALGVLLAWLGLRAITAIRPDDLGILTSVRLDTYVLRYTRSEERRVGKECRSRWSAGH